MLRARPSVVSLLCAVGLAAASASSAGAATTTATYTPFAPDGTLLPGLSVSEDVSGQCGEEGDWASTVNPGAYRCSTDRDLAGGANLLDPCFSEPPGDGTDEAESVVCPGSPTSRRVVRIRTGFIAPISSSPDRVPWALQIAGGRTCVLTSGASSVVRGRRVNYVCDGRGLRALVGTPRRRAATWTIALVRSFEGAGYRRVKVKRAWY